MILKPRRIVLTGGPGAGKTAALELIKRTTCEHVAVLPEAASILFDGGFPRDPTLAGRSAAQRAIFHVQVELEAVFAARPGVEVLLCDRGTLDGIAYYPGPPAAFFDELGTSEAEQLARYDAVIHMEPPAANHGYHREGPRIESAREAAEIDARIVAAWSRHPRRYSVASERHFLEKAKRVLEIVEAELPADRRAARAGSATRLDPSTDARSASGRKLAAPT